MHAAPIRSSSPQLIQLEARRGVRGHSSSTPSSPRSKTKRTVVDRQLTSPIRQGNTVAGRAGKSASPSLAVRASDGCTARRNFQWPKCAATSST
eukprot:772818-Karenia_brevis.AAC.1